MGSTNWKMTLKKQNSKTIFYFLILKYFNSVQEDMLSTKTKLQDINFLLLLDLNIITLNLQTNKRLV
jgi:hypothetical protein